MHFRFKICFVKKDTVLFTSPTILLITLLGSVKFCPRQNKLRFEGIKEHQNESWEDCENKIYDLLENKLEMDNENAFIDSSNKNIELGRNTRIDHDLKLLKFRFLRTRLIF